VAQLVLSDPKGIPVIWQELCAVALDFGLTCGAEGQNLGWHPMSGTSRLRPGCHKQPLADQSCRKPASLRATKAIDRLR
jgi:hypothetical protein